MELPLLGSPVCTNSDTEKSAATAPAGESVAPSVAPAGAQPGHSSQPQHMAYTLDMAHQTRAAMTQSSTQSFAQLRSVLPAELVNRILEDAFQLFKAEPTLVEITPPPTAQVIVVGDTHGQYHDVCRLLDLMGPPDSNRIYIFNGDYVDRGAWGVELMVLLLLLKLACPSSMYMLRGNHESSTCTKFYGFKGEVDTKFSPTPTPGPVEDDVTGLPGVVPPILKPHPDAKAVYKSFKKVFSVLPLAALVQNKTLILHGGLFRHPTQNRKVGGKRGRRLGYIHKLELGSLEDLRTASKGGLDPDGCGASVVAADVLWSDPVIEPGLQMNDARGVGLTFGPDVTQRFLEANSLSLVIRSHEGPDARSQRTDLPDILRGYALDHATPAGKLVTVFSAPDYPQFQDGSTRYNNQGAVVLLEAPDFCQPQFQSFDAALPRPPARAFYDYLAFADTDEEVGSEDEHASDLALSMALSEYDDAIIDSTTMDTASAGAGPIDMDVRNITSTSSPAGQVSDTGNLGAPAGAGQVSQVSASAPSLQGAVNGSVHSTAAPDVNVGAQAADVGAESQACTASKPLSIRDSLQAGPEQQAC